MQTYDFAIVGAGIAGAGLAAELAGLAGGDARIVMLEAEDAPGYHSTGRSAAFWSETYGGPGVVPLSLASGDMLREGGFLTERGALHMARTSEPKAVAHFIDRYAGTRAELEAVGRDRLDALVPGLLPDWREAVWEPACADIDVARLHQHYLGRAARAGVVLECRARLVAASRENGVWKLACADGRELRAATLVDAAGAWADEVARMAGAQPLGITPYRRTVVQLALKTPPPADLPLVLGIDGSFYFKPESGKLWLSPHDEVPAPAGDAAAHELAVAQAIARFEQVVDWPVARVERRWAGLRSFAPDRLPVFGWGEGVDGFFWCAGQGGFGIQTAPAASRLCAQLLAGSARDAMTSGLVANSYLPQRFG